MTGQGSSISSKWKKFCEYTSVHGLVYAFSKKHMPRLIRTGWKLLWLAVFALCSYQSGLNVVQYSKYNISVSTTYVTNSSLAFPSVTFTPMTMGSKSNLGSYELKNMFFSTWFSDNDKEFLLLMKDVSFQTSFVPKYC